MCYAEGEVRVGAKDVFLGEIVDCKFYIGAAQFEYWRHTQLIIDVVPGRGSGFSLEAPEGVRFLTRSRVFSDDEAAALAADGELSRRATPLAPARSPRPFRHSRAWQLKGEASRA